MRGTGGEIGVVDEVRMMIFVEVLVGSGGGGGMGDVGGGGGGMVDWGKVADVGEIKGSDVGGVNAEVYCKGDAVGSVVGWWKLVCNNPIGELEIVLERRVILPFQGGETEEKTEDFGDGVNAYSPPKSAPVVMVPSWP
ncbi:hypothetical protein Tco_1511115 [Tanacetum coccineum]